MAGLYFLDGRLTFSECIFTFLIGIIKVQDGSVIDLCSLYTIIESYYYILMAIAIFKDRHFAFQLAMK